ncbi:YkgJ family cysteine cluster protein [Desulfovibrio sp. UIB00]|uniref:YkgJ family cysteine cluster protein n=1 Tax=Desulfovibrio sp. UIB00 TaxID=2804314 RepID=UPI001F1026BA|nr:YkgJ family cysteine cluster protein [Desulfovibrio sp. UIB00]MCH5143956.1 YkgJ family cysteine cluster protein [Desulfovibrio sp. UIB00]
MSSDASRELLDSLPELKPDETFCFDCNPDVPCFNRCCAELTLPLTPYDVLRLRRNLGLGSEEFLGTFTTLRSFPDTGFPLPMLRMLDGPDEPCPFVTPAGCSVYEDRPGACRYYPLGRGTKMATDGVSERFFVVREPHCLGFDKGTVRTPHQWLENEELKPFNTSNDRYMRLMAMVRATGQPLEPRLVTMIVLCLFQIDKFRELITNMRVFSHVDISDQRKAAIMEDSQKGDEAALDFGLDWMELVIFGQSQGLARK